MVGTGRALALAAMCAVGLACEPATPTQVLVIFEADEAVAARAAKLRIDVLNEERRRQAWDINLVEGTTGATSFPVTLPLVPRGGDASRTFEVVGEVLDADEEVVARVRALSGYVEGELREIRLRFGASCADVLCGFRTTCIDGRCADACIDPVRRGQPSPFRACEQPIDAAVSLDAGTDAGRLDPTGCDDDHVGRLFCDGFEQDVASGWDRVRQTRGTITRVVDPVYRGDAALEAQSNDGEAYVFVATDALDGIAPELWVRMYVRVPSGQEVVRFNLLYVGEDAAPWGGVEMGLLDGGRMFVKPNPDDATYQTAEPVFPFDQWACVEVHLVMNETAGSVEHYLNGASVGTAAMIDTFPDTGIASMNVGLGLTVAEQPPIAVYVDEVVADAVRIGCD